ncbi:MAG: hypothetical protein ACFUZC_12040 [Chthoniobacteraceae bacterium]
MMKFFPPSLRPHSRSHFHTVCTLAVLSFILYWTSSQALAAEAARGWAFRQGSVEVKVAPSGQIERWVVDGKALVNNTTAASPLELLTTGDHTLTFAPERFEPATGGEGVCVSGKLADGAKRIAIPVSVTYQIQNGGRNIAVDIQAEKVPSFELRSYRWTLGLNLNPRKRVFYLSDYGLPWDMLYFHQTMIKGGGWELMKEPEPNIWRYFALDQFSPKAYRLWKSESATTAPLVLHEGQTPAPSVQVYDQTKGVTLDFPQLKERAPASLRVDADGGASLEVQFHPASVPPVSSGQSGAFARQHLLLTAHTSEAAVLAWQKELLQRNEAAFSPRPDPDSLLRESEWVRTAPQDTSVPQYASTGFPFARGTLTDPAALRVKVAGAPVPAQGKPLAYWPDGSVKWALLTFPVDPAKAQAECPPPRVSLRNERYLPLEIFQAAAPSPAPSAALSVKKQDSGEVEISNNGLQVRLAPGEDWLQQLKWRGTEILDRSGGRKPLAYCEYLVGPEAVFPFDQRAKGGAKDFGTLKVDSIAVEESGPLRAIVRLEGLTSNQEPTRLVLRLEFLAGRPEIRIAHTAVFRYKDPRKTFLTGMGLELPFNRAAFPKAGVAGQSVAAHAELVQQTPLAQALWADAAAPKTTHTLSGLRLAGPAGGLSAIIRDFEQLTPKALAVDVSKGTLRLELWPDRSEPMDTRRYSDILHQGHLEAGKEPVTSMWVPEVYYKTDPVCGISRTHEMLLAFDQPGAPERSQSAAADFQSQPLAWSGWPEYEKTGVVLPSSSQEKAPRAWDSWTRLARFFLYHRELHCWKGFWNYGDFRHRFQGGYGWIIPPEALKTFPTGNLMKLRKVDSRAINDWCLDIGAYGWTNTEGLPNLFLLSEYLRHGNRQIYFAAEALAARSRDVIIRQEGRWLALGTRHGVQPWSCGDHEERQTTTTEYRLQYFLNGDGRSRDVVDNIVRNAYNKGVVSYEPDHSGRLTNFLFHWELTGAPQEGERLAKYVSTFVSPEGIYVKPTVRFPEIKLEKEREKLNNPTMFMETFGGMHTLIEYEQLTQDPALRNALIKMAEAIIASDTIESGKLGEGEYGWPPVAFAALHAADPKPYQDFLRRYIEAYGWREAYQMVTANPAHWSGSTGYISKAVIAMGLFWQNWAPYVTLALPEGDLWTPAIAEAYNKTEAQGRAPYSNRPGWQSEFDGIPEIDAYMAHGQPWRTHETKAP